MGILQTEIMTGYEVRRVSASKAFHQVAAFAGENQIAIVSGRTEKMALKELERAVYEIHRDTVFKAAGYRCEECRAFHVSCHHKKFRSHGGTHEIANLQALCENCHAFKHGR